MARRAAQVAGIILLFGGCRAPEDAAQAYRRFATAYQARDVDKVWAGLSKDSRALLTKNAQAEATAVGKPVPADGRRHAFLNAGPGATKLKDATITGGDDTKAVVHLVDERGGSDDVELLFEDGAWRVVLSAAPPSPATQNIIQ